MLYAVVTVSVPAMVSVGEGDGTVTVCATLTVVEATERDFTITLATSNGTGKINLKLWILQPGLLTALDYFDYTRVSSNIIFPSGSVNAIRCVDISVINDNALERSQTFTVTLYAPDPDVMYPNNMTTVTITDDDG